MRYPGMLVVCCALLTSAIGAQTQNSAQEKAANLRSQLSIVEAKQLELQTRLKDLDEELKPENIASGLAGVGSTHPEELREQRRRQLEIERNGVQAQLNLLVTSHTRLETAIANADAEAYRQSAAPTSIATTPSGVSASGPSIDQTNEATAPTRHRRGRKKKIRKARRTHHTETSLNSTSSEQLLITTLEMSNELFSLPRATTS
jgi:hypothetical protein